MSRERVSTMSGRGPHQLRTINKQKANKNKKGNQEKGGVASRYQTPPQHFVDFGPIVRSLRRPARAAQSPIPPHHPQIHFAAGPPRAPPGGHDSGPYVGTTHLSALDQACCGLCARIPAGQKQSCMPPIGTDCPHLVGDDRTARDDPRHGPRPERILSPVCPLRRRGHQGYRSGSSLLTSHRSPNRAKTREFKPFWIPPESCVPVWRPLTRRPGRGSLPLAYLARVDGWGGRKQKKTKRKKRCKRRPSP